MTPTKLLVGQIAVVFAIVVLGVWAATQWCADMLGYQQQLGAPWFLAAGWPVYMPWKLFEWWFRFEAYAPEVFDKAGMLAAASGFMGCVAAIAGSLWRARQHGLVTTYGSSRWALKQEIERAGLFRPSGVFLGKLQVHYLRHDGPEHVMAFAPTRSGKGVGLVVPTLLSWIGSAVIHDIKGENWQLTAGWRSKFSHCLLFNPANPQSARYNPLLEVRKGPHEVRDVQNIADILVDPEGALERRSHWEKTSHALLVGAILHVLYAEEEKTLATVHANSARAALYRIEQLAQEAVVIGITAVLHSWGSAMTHHPHVHMIVPGGGIAPDGSRWVSSRPAFLLPVRVLGKLFRRLFLTRLVALHDVGRLAFLGSMAHLAERRAFLQHLSSVRKKRWVVYAKAPFAGPKAVLAYLSRYTHRVAISNSRLIAFDESGVTFRYKDYRRDGADRQQVMTLATDEFIRRFLLHVLPRGFHHTRHYGLLAGSARKASLALARELLDVAAPTADDIPTEPYDFRPPCPCCGGRMIVIEVFERRRQPRGPPDTTATNRKGSP